MVLDGITDEQLAVAMMAAQEGEAVDAWFDKWRDDNFASWGSMAHSGDCTKQPWTCCRCLYESMMQEARDVRRLLNADE